MMLKMMNPMGSMPSVPGTGDDKKEEEKGMTMEEKKEAERLRQEALRQAERERRKKYKAQDEEREVVRAAMREKYNIEAPVNEEDIEDEDEDEDGFGGGKKKEDEEEEDPVEQARKLAEKQLNEAKTIAQDKCSLQ